MRNPHRANGKRTSAVPLNAPPPRVKAARATPAAIGAEQLQAPPLAPPRRPYLSGAALLAAQSAADTGVVHFTPCVRAIYQVLYHPLTFNPTPFYTHHPPPPPPTTTTPCTLLCSALLWATSFAYLTANLLN